MRVRMRTDREGVAIVLVAVMMIALLATMSLGVELGMAYVGKTDAQRAADASALAGASVFLDPIDPYILAPKADSQARDYAARNTVRARPIDPVNEVTVQVIPDSQKVRVWVEKAGLPTWFAKLLGFDQLTVRAMAAAEATHAGKTTCVKPWALVDVWDEKDVGPEGEDKNGNRFPDPGEEWKYDPTGDQDEYRPLAADLSNAANATSYGSNWRNMTTPYTADQGRDMVIKFGNPAAFKDAGSGGFMPNPGLFLPWRMTQPDGDESKGGADYRDNIYTCNTAGIEIGADYYVEPGAMQGPTRQGVDSLIAQDPQADFVEVEPGKWEVVRPDGVAPPANPTPTGSPRLMVLAMISPEELLCADCRSGMQPIHFVDFALLWIDRIDNKGNVYARFSKFVGGIDEGTIQGANTKILRLVE